VTLGRLQLPRFDESDLIAARIGTQKGRKDRRTMLPAALKERLRAHLVEARAQHRIWRAARRAW
jgi:hypothetical protein